MKTIPGAPARPDRLSLHAAARPACLATVAALALGSPAAATAATPTPSATAATTRPARAWTADLRVDADRNGTVDLTGTSDEAGEDAARAIFLPNLDDDARRCPLDRRVPTKGQAPKAGTKRVPLPLKALEKCHDAADEVVNGAADALDLAPVHVAAVRDLPDGATGRIAVTRGASSVRLFRRTGSTWTKVTPATVLTTQDLRAGVQLGLEGRDIVRDPARGDGRATIVLTIADRAGATSTTSTDTVTLRVAPMLTSDHTQRAAQVLVKKGNRKEDPAQVTFNVRLQGLARRQGVVTHQLPVLDPWVQDFVEPMHVSMPSPSGMQSMRLLVRSRQLREVDGLYTLRGRDIGVVGFGTPKSEKDGGDTLDSFGNLETIPAYTHRGKSFPAGRIVMGMNGRTKAKPSPQVLTALRAQGLQDPLFIDTSITDVEHVDEQLQFLPAKNARGWTIAVVDAKAGLELLRQAKAAGLGSKRILDLPKLPTTPASPEPEQDAPKDTVDSALRTDTSGLVADNLRAAAAIEKNLAILQRETGVTDAEVVRIPGLFSGPRDVSMPKGLPKKEIAKWRKARAKLAKGPRAVGSLVPNAVNSVVVGDGHVIAAQQFTLKVGGKDLFGDAVEKAYAKAGFTVGWIDDLVTYHAGGGEVHCGTNTLRVIDRAWWKFL